MGLFNKKPKEKNEIENKVLKENIANTALAQLSQGEDYNENGGCESFVWWGWLWDSV